jgi:hypothetical protein
MVGERRSRGLRPWMFTELRDGIVRLDPDAARDYAHAVMPRLRTPALKVGTDFAVQLRRSHDSVICSSWSASRASKEGAASVSASRAGIAGIQCRRSG